MSLIKHSADSPWRKRRKTEEEVLDYQSSLGVQSWDIERGLADQIMNHVKKHKLKYKLDKLTRGHGNCFMIAVLQQLQQEHIYQGLSQQLKNLADGFSQMKLRQVIADFVNQGTDSRISGIKSQYNEARSAGLMAESWEDYWERLRLNGNWADTFFVHATAFFLKMNIQMVDTSASPFYMIEGTRDTCLSKTIVLGLKTNVHYQSLLHTHSPQIVKPESEIEEACPSCNKKTKNLIKHIQRSKCKGKVRASSPSVISADMNTLP